MLLRKVLALSQILRVIVKPLSMNIYYWSRRVRSSLIRTFLLLVDSNLLQRGRRSLSASQMSLGRGVDFLEASSFELSV